MGSDVQCSVAMRPGYVGRNNVVVRRAMMWLLEVPKSTIRGRVHRGSVGGTLNITRSVKVLMSKVFCSLFCATQFDCMASMFVGSQAICVFCISHTFEHSHNVEVVFNCFLVAFECSFAYNIAQVMG